MGDKIKCPKCGRIERTKNGFHSGKQRYKCKNRGYNYTEGKRCYLEHVKQKEIKYYLEGNEFRRIERLMNVSHISVINWVKKAAKEIRKRRKFK